MEFYVQRYVNMTDDSKAFVILFRDQFSEIVPDFICLKKYTFKQNLGIKMISFNQLLNSFKPVFLQKGILEVNMLYPF